MAEEPTSQKSLSAESAYPRPGAWTYLTRALALRCPRCGVGAIFRGRFAMHDCCRNCGRQFNRAPGYFLGSIYFNYGVTAVADIVFFIGLSLYFGEVQTGWRSLTALTVFSVAFPLWFFRYARALWIAFDERWDPWQNDQDAVRDANLN